MKEFEEIAKEEKYSNIRQIKFNLEQKFEDILQFICKEERITVQQAVTYALILEKDNPMFF